jgi:hypothetical protein
MPAGFQVTKDALNQRAGAIVIAGESWFEDVERLAAYLAATPDGDLTAMGFTSQDVAAVKSSFVDLENLRKVAYGQQAQANANNFFFWGSKLRGIL